MQNSSSAEAVYVLRVVSRLRTLAQDKQNQPMIVRRGVLPSLITFLQNDRIEVRQIALETLRMLSSHADNKQLMAQQYPDLISNLVKNFKQHEKLKAFVTDILVNLSDYVNEKELEGISLRDLLKVVPVQDASGSASGTGGAASSALPKRNMVLEVSELAKGEQVRQQVQQLVLSAKGTISYTIVNKRVNLYTRTPPEALVELFSKNSLSATLVQDTLCETESSAKSKQAATASEKKEEMRYLSPEKKRQEQLYKQSLVMHGNEDNFEDRLASRKKQKEETPAQQNQQQTGTVSRFLNKITSVFW